MSKLNEQVEIKASLERYMKKLRHEDIELEEEEY